jgi:hypothetical protein
MTAPSTVSSNAPAGIWRRAAESSAVWRTLTPARRAWAVIERAIAHVTMGRYTEAAGRRVERVVASSTLVGWADRAGGTVARASEESTTVAWVKRRLEAVAGMDAVARLRFGAQVVVIGSLVALTVQMLGPRPVTLMMIVPAIAAVGALLVFVLARPFAAARKDRR